MNENKIDYFSVHEYSTYNFCSLDYAKTNKLGNEITYYQVRYCILNYKPQSCSCFLDIVTYSMFHCSLVNSSIPCLLNTNPRIISRPFLLYYFQETYFPYINSYTFAWAPAIPASGNVILFLIQFKTIHCIRELYRFLPWRRTVAKKARILILRVCLPLTNHETNRHL